MELSSRIRLYNKGKKVLAYLSSGLNSLLKNTKTTFKYDITQKFDVTFNIFFVLLNFDLYFSINTYFVSVSAKRK